jgi:alkylation response protein AidB-like acyl-CoA dehydrogenase
MLLRTASTRKGGHHVMNGRKIYIFRATPVGQSA